MTNVVNSYLICTMELLCHLPLISEKYLPNDIIYLKGPYQTNKTDSVAVGKCNKLFIVWLSSRKANGKHWFFYDGVWAFFYYWSAWCTLLLDDCTSFDLWWVLRQALQSHLASGNRDQLSLLRDESFFDVYVLIWSIEKILLVYDLHSEFRFLFSSSKIRSLKNRM